MGMVCGLSDGDFYAEVLRLSNSLTAAQLEPFRQIEAAAAQCRRQLDRKARGHRRKRGSKLFWQPKPG